MREVNALKGTFGVSVSPIQQTKKPIHGIMQNHRSAVIEYDISNDNLATLKFKLKEIGFDIFETSKSDCFVAQAGPFTRKNVPHALQSPFLFVKQGEYKPEKDSYAFGRSATLIKDNSSPVNTDKYLKNPEHNIIGFLQYRRKKSGYINCEPAFLLAEYLSKDKKISPPSSKFICN